MARKESIPAEQLLERYEEAVHRAGWLEGQLALFKAQSDDEKQRAASVEEAQRKRERELEELSGRVEERLSSARALEASFKEEREEWEGRLRDQARMLFEMEQRLKNLQEQKQAQERIAAGLTGELGALRSEYQQLLNINEELTDALKKSHKQWKLWK
jgi:chromosome segregation ATPase